MEDMRKHLLHRHCCKNLTWLLALDSYYKTSLQLAEDDGEAESK